MLPNRRPAVSFTLAFQGERYDVTTGFYEDGRFGEIFINRNRDKTAAKLSQHLDAVCRDSAILMSLALQHGVDLANLKHSITRDEDGVPMSIVGAIVDSVNQKEPPHDRADADVRRPDPAGGSGAQETSAQADEKAPVG
jgi:hypothetical protein